MAIVIIGPSSAVPISESNTFPHIYVGDGVNSQHEETLGVAASIASDSTWRLRFFMPPELPSGTAKLWLVALADAITGDAKINAKWASVAMEEDPSSATLNAEAVQTITWSTDDDDQYKSLKIDLDADTIQAGEVVVMDLVFETSGWTLAVVSGWKPFIIWE